ncbi:hypothetical protein Q7P35_010210 [Cladosporium inversicolor]
MAIKDADQSNLDVKPSHTSTIATRSIASTSSSQNGIADELEETVLGRIKGDSYIVTWYGPDDKGNPQNLSLWRKWLVTMSVALYFLTTTFASSVFSAAVVVTAKEFGVCVETMVISGTSMFMVGFDTGPIVFGPISEYYGRVGPLFVAQAQNLAMVLVFRFLQLQKGVLGAAPSAILSGMLADIWTPKQRGFTMPCAATFLAIGPILGPTVGASIVQSSLGWRWIEYITAISFLAVIVITYPVLTETYAPVLMARRANRMRHMTRNWEIRAKSEENATSFRDIAERFLTRPAKMLALEPILLCMAFYLSVVFGLMYNLVMAYPISFAGERGWNAVQSGLPLLSILVGTVLGGLLISFTTNTRLAPDPQKGESPPVVLRSAHLSLLPGCTQETRLLLMLVGAVCLPCGILWFAWISSHPNPWPQIVAGVPIGLGIQLINMQGLNYIVDCYGINANSAVAGITFMRSLFASGFPVFAKSMYSYLGVPWAMTILALCAIVLAPVPVLFYYFGSSIRARSKWKPT